MVRNICRNILILSQKAQAATKEDAGIGQDLLDTLKANQERCVGMAANMIGVSKAIIVVNVGPADMLMYNPVIMKRSDPYQAEEGCLSLDGIRKTQRFKDIVVEYQDENWVRQRRNFSGWTAEIIQHECDHLQGKII
jgi:peptide deformylase